ncbi:hypothetical protein AGOR_G00205170 [Albula goreensis]|uniref:R-spondin Fu-CRD domain-containing protein n=1 Tax=Albula goreensis TaxID=1534307 RepID=A0A8T3CNL4_9TELE|nr:hypothetical protein AGOR_G00205170 [Albula goreensis]
MQLQVLSFVLFLHCMEYTDSQQHASRHRQHKQTPGLNQGCEGGCLTCSDYNGCLSCKPRLFIYLERNGMRQIGVCLSSCPNGYYGTRSPEINKCTKCKSDCDSCFNRNFCTRCKSGFYLHRGKCQDSCPEGLEPSVTQRECIPGCAGECETCLNSDTCTKCKAGLFLLHGKCLHVCPEDFEQNEQLMACTPHVHCEVGEWGEWSPCSRRGKTCGFRRGEETGSAKPCRLPRPTETPVPPSQSRGSASSTERDAQGGVEVSGDTVTGGRRRRPRTASGERDGDRQGGGRPGGHGEQEQNGAPAFTSSRQRIRKKQSCYRK